jgi:hypothetical protein
VLTVFGFVQRWGMAGRRDVSEMLRLREDSSNDDIACSARGCGDFPSEKKRPSVFDDTYLFLN